jgi:hypothetical protein
MAQKPIGVLGYFFFEYQNANLPIASVRRGENGVRLAIYWRFGVLGTPIQVAPTRAQVTAYNSILHTIYVIYNLLNKM